MKVEGAAPLFVEIGAGELMDRATILAIKNERIADPAKRANVRARMARARTGANEPARRLPRARRAGGRAEGDQRGPVGHRRRDSAVRGGQRFRPALHRTRARRLQDERPARRGEEEDQPPQRRAHRRREVIRRGLNGKEAVAARRLGYGRRRFSPMSNSRRWRSPPLRASTPGAPKSSSGAAIARVAPACGPVAPGRRCRRAALRIARMTDCPSRAPARRSTGRRGRWPA